MTLAKTFDAVRGYGQSGGIGARLYDRLIGEVAVAHVLSAIVTWHGGHMHGLFQELRVATPVEFARGPD